ncbi:AAA family ATPase [Kribbella sp. NPDC051137]|uniref:AAA family ATPase n=1 Tax=Kribbella sp. NPDC051137 TaxID=3155045 RepID=UPI003448C904
MTDGTADGQQAAPGDDESVVDTVVALADRDPALTERQKMLVLAAMDSDEALSDEFGTDGESSTTGKSAKTASTDAEPVRAFLTSITVSGFRGIGAEARLDLHPGPGLTVVAGRNGSGKSSFSEALEFALTGESYRWKGKKAFWTNSWRNLHHVQSARVRIALAEEVHGRTEIGVEWATDDGLHDAKIWTQRHGKTRTSGVGALGWGTALELYRPILSYDELSQRLEGTQTDLYRSLESILGLDRIADGIDRLNTQVKHLKVASDKASASKSALKRRLEHVDDARAQAVVGQLGKQKPDLDLVKNLTLGDAATDGIGEQLRGITNMSVPDRHAVESASDELLRAVQQLTELADDASTHTESRSRLLEMALQFHSQHGDQVCPVCSGNVLDNDWHERAQADLAADRASVVALRSAREDLAARRAAARALVDVPELSSADGELGLPTLTEARAVLKAWREAPEADAEFARHLAVRVTSVVDVLTRLRDEATAALSERDDTWRDLVGDVLEWVKLRGAAEASAQDLHDARASQSWLKTNAEQLRNQRLEPLAEKAKWVWSHLRKESNIDLDAITLSGQRNRGTVKLAARVDGEPADALPVMSQGELNAIAMALFLPRAAMPASPLRFVVLDDPVQAMDPAKVDGLAEILVEYAKDRQVIVFSHDDRLTQAVRRTAPEARIVNVERGVDSMVQVVPCQSPARRYIEDAQELLKDKAVPQTVITKAFPGYVRLAVEAAAHEVHFFKQLSKGTSRHKVEATWDSASTTSNKVALAVFGDKSFGLNGWQRTAYRNRTLGICRKAVHEGLTGSVDGAIEDLRRTVDDILGQRK